MTKRLTAAAEADNNDFKREYGRQGCTCFMSPPCNYCMHPGNPANQAEDETAWEEDEPERPVRARDQWRLLE